MIYRDARTRPREACPICARQPIASVAGRSRLMRPITHNVSGNQRQVAYDDSISLVMLSWNNTIIRKLCQRLSVTSGGLVYNRRGSMTATSDSVIDYRRLTGKSTWSFFLLSVRRCLLLAGWAKPVPRWCLRNRVRQGSRQMQKGSFYSAISGPLDRSNLAELFIPTPTRLLRKHSSDAAITRKD